LTTFALDTATPTPSLALVGDDGVIAELWLGRVPGGGRRVLEAAHHLLGACGVVPADLEQIVVGVGPGGFTGIRIGIATALGLGQALGIPVHGASSLEALALGATVACREGELIAPVIDARRREVFAGAYAADTDRALRQVIAPAAWDPADFAHALAQAGPAVIAGDGAALVPALPTTRLAPEGPVQQVRAALLVARVAQEGPLPVLPQYLRLPDAEEKRLERLAAEAPA